MLQFITHSNHRYGYLEGAELALRGGCRWIQLRMKDASEREVREVAYDLQPLCRKYDATFILDDRVELARDLDADGVHLGKTDMPIDEARKILGPDKIIGGTANTAEDIRLHVARGANYIGCGPFRFTTTKERLSPLLGLEGYRQIVAATADLQIPIIAIGGITVDDVPSLMATGITGIAISGAILNATNPIQTTEDIIRSMSSN